MYPSSLQSPSQLHLILGFLHASSHSTYPSSGLEFGPSGCCYWAGEIQGQSHSPSALLLGKDHYTSSQARQRVAGQAASR